MTITLYNRPLADIHVPVYILFGKCEKTKSGLVRVYHQNQQSFPPQYYEVNDGYFKALIHVNPGENSLGVEVCKGKFIDGVPSVEKSSYSGESVLLDINYVPLLNNPPVHLCILVAKDSPLQFDSPSFKIKEEGNSLDLAIKKLRMGGRLMQAFTQQQMFTNGFGQRCFRFEEESMKSTISKIEEQAKVVRSDIKIHILKSELTLKELRDPNLAQQNPNGSNTGGLFGIAMNALKKYGGPFSGAATSGRAAQAAVLFLDTHWDPNSNLILTHAALGGGDDDIKLAIFGSHGVWSWPANFEELTKCFTDTTEPSRKEVANDCNECSSSWECLNVTLGAFMHEIGHLLGCPHQINGVMMRDYVTFNRTFLTKERKCIRTGKGEWSPILPKDECTWHRLDIIRFLYHDSFALPPDFLDLSFKPKMIQDLAQRKRLALKPSVYPTSTNAVMLESLSGVFLIELHVEDWSRAHIEYLPRCLRGPGPVTEAILSYEEFQNLLPENYRNKKLKVSVLANGGGQLDIDDLSNFIKQQGSSIPITLDNGSIIRGFKSCVFGATDRSNETPLAIIAGYKVTKVRIHHGAALDGLEFFLTQVEENHEFSEKIGEADAPPPIPPRDYKTKISNILKLQNTKSNTSSNTPNSKPSKIVKLGNAKHHYTDFELHDNEYIASFNIRSGGWVDAIQIVLNTGRTSDMLGNTSGGSMGQLHPPSGSSIIGLYGRLGQWLDAIGIIYG
ncbi:hypothetical protein PACTADRAFT_15486 [Pachysolen tannophilus NRRL Y-2460]|uniref:Jacalin-type lectin domain-containing protein n=1 Tax=Pachysolen tannophilus NRRL Y-2460 TaxID=669874 RepID=A0A1E4TYZ8_PACTA|nr:hypothetical protein PACTADRAFT_15486 [Pachysolen tannophilus NRRL Y-2460]